MKNKKFFLFLAILFCMCSTIFLSNSFPKIPNHVKWVYQDKELDADTRKKVIADLTHAFTAENGIVTLQTIIKALDGYTKKEVAHPLGTSTSDMHPNVPAKAFLSVCAAGIVYAGYKFFD